jgi:hypothetical protein
VAIVIADVNINVRNAPDGAILSVLRPGAEVPVLGYNDDESWTQILLADEREGWVASFLLEIEDRPVSDVETQSDDVESDDATSDDATEEATEDTDDAQAAVQRSIAKGQGQRTTFKQIRQPSQVDDEVPEATVTVDDEAEPTEDADEIGTEEATDEATDEADEDETATPRPTRTPRATATPRSTQAADDDATEEADDDVFGVDMDDDGQLNVPLMSDADQRWQSYTIGLLAIIGLIVLGNLFYLIRHLLRRGRA